jgi:hypothetical protein
MKRKTMIIIIAFWGMFMAQAQTIKIELTQFPEKQYVFTLAKDDIQDTITERKLVQAATLTIPVSKKRI